MHHDWIVGASVATEQFAAFFWEEKEVTDYVNPSLNTVQTCMRLELW